MSEEKQTRRAAEELLAMLEDEEEHEAAVAAVEAIPIEQLEAEYEAHLRAKGAKKPPEPANVVPLAARRRSDVPWTVVLAAAAVAILAIGYAWKTTRPRPEDDLANRHHAPEPPPSLAPPEPTREAPPDDLVAHPPPKPCKPLSPGVARIEGTIRRDGERFVLVPDAPVCGANEESIEELELAESTPQVDLARLGVAHVRVEGRAAPRDASSALVLRVDRAAVTR